MRDKLNEIGIHELYSNDPILADKLLWDREVNLHTRRGFLKRSALLSMSAALGACIPFADKMPGGMIPAALADSGEAFMLEGKQGLRVLNDRPLNAETPPHLLDDDFTPAKYFFVRNNGIPPDKSRLVAPDDWRLDISGESCLNAKSFSVHELKQTFAHHTYALTLECGGNGRSEFDPPAKGNQWTTGAVGCAKWTGIRLKDLLNACGIKGDAVYIGYYGADTHLNGDPNEIVISRGVTIAKALENESLIAWGFNGEDIPYQNGFPLRLVTAGWPASTSGKWLTRLVIRNQVHDGKKMTGQSYRLPCNPVAPGSKVADAAMCIIESMRVKSLITFPKSGVIHPLKERFAFRGKAWAGDLEVVVMQVSIDFGASWQSAALEKPANRLAWQKWSAEIRFPKPGYYEVWAKATDSLERAQPTILPDWNPRGYMNNACHRIAVQVV